MRGAACGVTHRALYRLSQKCIRSRDRSLGPHSVVFELHRSSRDLLIPRTKMSHTVTITRTTAVSSGTVYATYINCGYLSTWPGILKLTQLLLGTACVGVAAAYMDDVRRYTSLDKAWLFYLLVAVAFLIGTFCLLTACLVTLSTASIISKTIYEVIYHGLATILYLAAGLTLIIEVNHYNDRYDWYKPMLAASIMGLVMAGLYLLSTFLANRSYRGI